MYGSHEFSNITVGELIERLNAYDANMPVFMCGSPAGFINESPASISLDDTAFYLTDEEVATVKSKIDAGISCAWFDPKQVFDHMNKELGPNFKMLTSTCGAMFEYGEDDKVDDVQINLIDHDDCHVTVSLVDTYTNADYAFVYNEEQNKFIQI